MIDIKSKMKRFLPASSRSFHGRADQQIQAINELRNGLTEIKTELDLLSRADLQLKVHELISELAVIRASMNELLEKTVSVATESDFMLNNNNINYADFVRGMEKSLTVSKINREAFIGYKNKFAGCSVVVCATGPTLNYYKPIENVIHIGVNRAFLKTEIPFDFLFAQCWMAISHCKKELMEYSGNNCVKFFGIEGVSWSNGEIVASGIPEDYTISCNARRYVTDFYSRGERCFDWTVDLCSESISTGWSSALPAIQFALYTNPAKLYIVGCDTSTPGHFTEETCDADYVELTTRTYMSEVAQIKENFIRMKSFATAMYPDTEIISINPIGLKSLFKDEYTESYLEKNPEIRTSLG